MFDSPENIQDTDAEDAAKPAPPARRGTLTPYVSALIASVTSSFDSRRAPRPDLRGAVFTPGTPFRKKRP